MKYLFKNTRFFISILLLIITLHASAQLPYRPLYQGQPTQTNVIRGWQQFTRLKNNVSLDSVLITDANGFVKQKYFAAGSTSPAGSNGEIQYNNSGSFGATSNFILQSASLTEYVKVIAPAATREALTIYPFTGQTADIFSVRNSTSPTDRVFAVNINSGYMGGSWTISNGGNLTASTANGGWNDMFMLFNNFGSNRKYSLALHDNNSFSIRDAIASQHRLTITNLGYVGISNETPSEKLDVSGNIRFTGALMPNNYPGTTGQILTSNGPGVPPTWENAASSIDSAAVHSVTSPDANTLAFGRPNGDTTTVTIAPVYTYATFILSQSGTAAPTSSAGENITGYTFTWTRTNTGSYQLTASGSAFTSGKTFIILGGLTTASGANINQFSYDIVSTSAIDFFTTDLSIGPADDLLLNTALEIRIYP